MCVGKPARTDHRERCAPGGARETVARVASAGSRARKPGSALHVLEERGGPTALHHALALLRDLPGFLAILAANRERQRSEPTLGDFLTTLEAIAECPFLQTTQRLF